MRFLRLFLYPDLSSWYWPINKTPNWDDAVNSQVMEEGWQQEMTTLSREIIHLDIQSKGKQTRRSRSWMYVSGSTNQISHPFVKGGF
jgi:hypothetical protein